jgi:hypothetical protein
MKLNKIFGILAMALFLFFGATLVASAECPAVTWNLTAGQYYVWGTLSVTNDAEYIYVTYTLDLNKANCTSFGTLHLWIGNDLANVPSTKPNKNNPGGIPIPGQFPFSYDASGLTSYTFKIHYSELSITGIDSPDDLCYMKLYIFAHAEMCNETAWGGDKYVNVGNPGRWYYYGEYTWCCEGPPPPICTLETAFAKGTHVFTTDKKSNPEKLPSLNLTRNRWGWAINLLNTGRYTYYIWAGAGLNNTANGTLVGTLTVDWDGSQAVVTYTMNTGYLLKEVHLYAADAAPTTIAPGQYGFLDYFDPGRDSYTFTVSLVDSDGVPGVWLIAHAIVEFVCK